MTDQIAESLTYIEIDVDICSLTYGNAPCTAELGVTGSVKCYNSLGTCQDRSNFDTSPTTIRFAKDNGLLPRSIEALPSVVDVQYTPAVVSLGENLGTRPTLRIRFKDHPHADTPSIVYDKYLNERTYDPFDQGTFFGKLRARHPFHRGRVLRWYDGRVGQTLAEMDVRTFLIENISGPHPDGTFEVVAKDVLKLSGRDRALAPAPSTGFLSSDLTAGTTSATIGPTNEGDTYSASGKMCIGGNEVADFTRADDDLTLTRGQNNTDDVDHDSEERLQECLEFSGADPADVIYSLLVDYAGVDPSYIDLAAWQLETSTYLGVAYSTLITEPTPVEELIIEILRSAGIALWYEPLTAQIRLQVLSGRTAIATLDESVVLAGSLKDKEQPNKRVSRVWTRYAQRNPTKDVDDEENYQSNRYTIDLVSEANEGQPSIRELNTRWIAAGGRAVVDRLHSIILSRYKQAPRNFRFSLYRYGSITPMVGSTYTLKSFAYQGADGSNTDGVNIQITSVNPMEDRYDCEAEEALFDASETDLLDRVLTFDADVDNIDIYEQHNLLYPEVTEQDVYDGVTLTVIITASAIVGSSDTGTPALSLPADSFPVGFPVDIIVKGRIQGKGGKGGSVSGTSSERVGKDGGTALYLRHEVTLFDEDGEIFGGSGGGGATYTAGKDFAGGGGAGTDPGDGGDNTNAGTAYPGTADAGGQGAEGDDGDGHYVRAGDGGDPGQDGTVGNRGGASGTDYAAGSAGSAIDGISYVLQAGSAGDRRGPEVN